MNIRNIMIWFLLNLLAMVCNLCYFHDPVNAFCAGISFTCALYFALKWNDAYDR
jgi:hypothetical protein